MGTLEPQVATATTDTPLTDGFHLVIDALKANGIDTIFGLPGIPITDLARKAQAAGMRVISFRHEQNAGNAAAIAGFLTQKPGICLTVSAPGFLNGLTALANATTNCFPMILISGSSEREIVDLQQGDYEEMDQLAIAKPLGKAAFRVLHVEDIGVGIARAIRAAVSGRPGGVYLDLPAKLFAQTMDAEAGRRTLIKVVDPAPRQIPAPDAVQRALDLLKSAKRPLIVLGKGAAYAQADANIRALVEKTSIPYLPMSMAKGLLPDTHEQCASAARSYVLPEADVVMLIGAELAALARQGEDLGRQEPQGLGRTEVHPSRHLAARGGQQRPHRRAGGWRHRLVRVGPARRPRLQLAQAAGRLARRRRRAQEQEHRQDGRNPGQESGADEFP
jgi:oxalyl-CoA decarboxylase